jgi:hypothetical protein
MGRAVLLAATAVAAAGLAVLVLEWVYRAQLVDTYAAELRASNRPEDLVDDGRPTVLAMGDSFTAGRASYAGILQDRLRRWRVVNAGIGGTGVLQALYVAPERFARFRPKILVYQIYVGNDLFDLRYPVNWRAIPPTRNAYWLLANHLRVAGWMNYRLGQLGGTLATAHADADRDAPFALDRYDPRVRTYLRAEPALFEDSVLVRGARAADYEILLAKLDELVARCGPDACSAALLVIPHVSQVEDAWVARMRALGASLDGPPPEWTADYPFVRRLREHFASRPGVRVLDPLPALRTAARTGPVYFGSDEHLNAQGQAVVAAFVAAQLGLD